MRTIVVGSRQSALALTQTGQVIAQLEEISAREGWEFRFEVKKIVTKGDRVLDVTLSKVGGKGLFVKEIEQAMLEGEIDLAVHSMKDVPSVRQPGLLIGAVPKRVDPRDALITKEGWSLDELPHGAKVGTSSLRRSAQLKAYRSDLNTEWIRGNIDSRIKKLETEGFDGILLAAAGLIRMGWEGKIGHYLPVDVCLPAVGQGALAIECRTSDEEVLELLSRLNDLDTNQAVRAERSFLAKLNGGCQIPIGAYATIKVREGDHVVLDMTGMVGDPDNGKVLKVTGTGSDPDRLGTELAEQLIAQGAEEILAKVRE